MMSPSILYRVVMVEGVLAAGLALVAAHLADAPGLLVVSVLAIAAVGAARNRQHGLRRSGAPAHAVAQGVSAGEPVALR